MSLPIAYIFIMAKDSKKSNTFAGKGAAVMINFIPA
jgi:hypothetical protein